MEPDLYRNTWKVEEEHGSRLNLSTIHRAQRMIDWMKFLAIRRYRETRIFCCRWSTTTHQHHHLFLCTSNSLLIPHQRRLRAARSPTQHHAAAKPPPRSCALKASVRDVSLSYTCCTLLFSVCFTLCNPFYSQLYIRTNVTFMYSKGAALYDAIE